VPVRPGQSGCVVSSAVEGDTYVTVHAPGIHNWEKRQLVVNCHWINATWQFPGPVVGQAGSEARLTTRLFRPTDQQPLAGYRVRYQLLDGPQALLLPTRR